MDMCPASTRDRTNLGGLDLNSEIPSFGDDDEDDPDVESNLYDRFNDAVSGLEKRGFKFDLTPPTEEVSKLPDDITGMSSSTTFAHYHVALKYWNFLASVISDLEGRLVTLKDQLEDIEAELKKGGKEGHEITLDKRYSTWKREIAKLKTQLILLEPKKSNLHRKMAMLSRSVTGAQVDASLGGRGENLNRPPPRRGTPGGYRTDL